MEVHPTKRRQPEEEESKCCGGGAAHRGAAAQRGGGGAAAQGGGGGGAVQRGAAAHGGGNKKRTKHQAEEDDDDSDDIENDEEDDENDEDPATPRSPAALRSPAANAQVCGTYKFQRLLAKVDAAGKELPVNVVLFAVSLFFTSLAAKLPDDVVLSIVQHLLDAVRSSTCQAGVFLFPFFEYCVRSFYLYPTAWTLVRTYLLNGWIYDEEHTSDLFLEVAPGLGLWKSFTRALACGEYDRYCFLTKHDRLVPVQIRPGVVVWRPFIIAAHLFVLRRITNNDDSKWQNMATNFQELNQLRDEMRAPDAPANGNADNVNANANANANANDDSIALPM
jgi:hypothetical protein